LARIGKYLIQDAGGIVVDVVYAVRDAVARRRRSARRRDRRRAAMRAAAQRRGRA